MAKEHLETININSELSETIGYMTDHNGYIGCSITDQYSDKSTIQYFAIRNYCDADSIASGALLGFHIKYFDGTDIKIGQFDYQSSNFKTKISSITFLAGEALTKFLLRISNGVLQQIVFST